MSLERLGEQLDEALRAEALALEAATALALAGSAGEALREALAQVDACRRQRAELQQAWRRAGGEGGQAGGSHHEN